MLQAEAPRLDDIALHQLWEDLLEVQEIAVRKAAGETERFYPDPRDPAQANVPHKRLPDVSRAKAGLPTREPEWARKVGIFVAAEHERTTPSLRNVRVPTPRTPTTHRGRGSSARSSPRHPPRAHQRSRTRSPSAGAPSGSAAPGTVPGGSRARKLPPLTAPTPPGGRSPLPGRHGGAAPGLTPGGEPLHACSMDLIETGSAELQRALTLWEAFLSLGDSSTKWKDYIALDEETRDKHMEFWVNDVKALPLRELTNHLHWLYRWQEWTAQNQINWKACRPTHFAIYLDLLQGYGPALHMPPT